MPETIVVAQYSSIHFEARLPSCQGPVGYGTDAEVAVEALGILVPRACGLPFEVRVDPWILE